MSDIRAIERVRELDKEAAAAGLSVDAEWDIELGSLTVQSRGKEIFTCTTFAECSAFIKGYVFAQRAKEQR